MIIRVGCGKTQSWAKRQPIIKRQQRWWDLQPTVIPISPAACLVT